MNGPFSDFLTVEFLMVIVLMAFVQFFNSTSMLMATGEGGQH